MRARHFMVAATTSFLVAIMCATASAGTYEVVACDPAGGGANHTWAKAITHGGMAAYPDPPSCAGGLVSRHNGQPQGWTVPAGAASRWFFYAPPDSAVVGIKMKALFQTKDPRWVSALSTGSQYVVGCFTGLSTCGVETQPWEFIPIPPSAVIYTEVFCPAGPCPAYWQPDGWFGNVFARSILTSAVVTISDGTQPVIGDPHGDAWTGAWISGTRSVTFNTVDNSGIARVQTLLDGKVRDDAGRSCDPNLVACPQWNGATLRVGTVEGISDGKHTLTLRAIDRAGNAGDASRDVWIDNTPPAAPQELAVEGGDGWRAQDVFRVTWRNPRQDHAPIAGVRARLCPGSGDMNACTAPFGDDGPNVEALKLRVSRPGDWLLRVWLKDAAGNAREETAAAPVHLRFDPDPPDLAILPTDPADPARVRVRGSDAISGLTRGEIELRRGSDGRWESLATEMSADGFSAMLPDDRLADGVYELRARAFDAAGNERSADRLADGSPARVALPVRVKAQLRVGKRERRRAKSARRGHRRIRTVYVTRPVLSHGRRVRLGGRLLAPGGNPLAGVAVDVFSRPDLPGGSETAVARLTTSRTGRFTYLLPAGASRVVRFRYAGTPTIRPQVREVRVAVRASSTIWASRRRVLNGESVEFSGRLRTGPVPAGGKLVEIQFFASGQWQTFATIRSASPSGRWRYTYRFRRTTGRRPYRLRLRIPREAGYPYSVGRSGVVRVHVRGL